MKSPAAITIGSDSVVGEVEVMTGVGVFVRICVDVAIGLGVNVFVCMLAGVEVRVDVRAEMFVGVVVALDIDPLVVMTNWGAKFGVPSLDE